MSLCPHTDVPLITRQFGLIKTFKIPISNKCFFSPSIICSPDNASIDQLGLDQSKGWEPLAVQTFNLRRTVVTVKFRLCSQVTAREAIKTDINNTTAPFDSKRGEKFLNSLREKLDWAGSAKLLLSYILPTVFTHFFVLLYMRGAFSDSSNFLTLKINEPQGKEKKSGWNILSHKLNYLNDVLNKQTETNTKKIYQDLHVLLPVNHWLQLDKAVL